MNQLFGLQHRGDRYLGMTAAMTQVSGPSYGFFILCVQTYRLNNDMEPPHCLYA